MDSKKSNITYIVFLAVVIPIFALIMSTPFWVKQERESASVDYNKVIEVNDYYIKVSNAVYLTDTKEVAFTLSIKPKYDGVTASEPTIKSVVTNLSYKTAKPLKLNGKNSDSQFYTASKIEDDFSYITIWLVTKTPDQTTPDKIDEFGDLIKGEVIKGETTELYFRIDKMDMLSMTSAQKKTMVTDKPLLTEITTVSKKSAAARQNNAAANTSSKPTATVTTTAKTQKTTTTTKKAGTVHASGDNAGNNNNDGGNYNYNGGGGQAGAVQQPTTNNNDNNYYQEPESQTQQTQPPQTVQTTHKPQTTAAPVVTQPSVVHPNGISLETDFPANNVKLTVGKTHVIRAVVKPDNANNKSVTWESNRQDIAKIDENGKITAITKGKAIITAKTKDGSLSASCMVTVE